MDSATGLLILYDDFDAPLGDFIAKLPSYSYVFIYICLECIFISCLGNKLFGDKKKLY